MLGQILALEDGITVILAASHGDGFYRAIVIHSTHPSYPVGGHDITVGRDSIEKARVITITDEHMTALTADAPIHGPTPTIEDFIAKIEAGVAEEEGAAL